ncbi:FAD-dependent oxidoreductase [Rhodococcus sp. Eu-32]|uniref:NAD(P)/FAD-dependent oxidoreductase n=1 Tax=Rhodococcus sp. Eu-32 TaxID=1017319 RepID=UPI001402579E|nr:FAD-dependent oxidoreductase [Rhodococcus sp. Eu-32]
MSDRVVVVGAGHAGVQIAASLRDNDFRGSITVFGDESHRPYHRPPLSKGNLSPTNPVDSITLRGPSFYDELGIEMCLGDPVCDIDRDAGKVVSASGRTVGFDGLALALGSSVRTLKVPGADLPGVLYLKNLDDAVVLNRYLAESESVVVVGGGFIGLEAAALARSAGLKATVVECDTTLMGRSVGPLVGGVFADLHRARGVDVRLGASVVEVFERKGKAAGVVLDDGELVEADFVVVGIGVVPRIELAERIGLEIDRGIVVDGASRTSVDGIVAAGDCTVTRSLSVPGVSRSLESVHNATLQAKNAARSLSDVVGDPEVEVPWFWSHQGDLKLQMVGGRDDADRTVIRGDPASGKFSILYFVDGVVVGAECVNKPGDFVLLRKLLNDGGSIDVALSEDVSLPLKQAVIA